MKIKSTNNTKPFRKKQVSKGSAQQESKSFSSDKPRVNNSGVKANKRFSVSKNNRALTKTQENSETRETKQELRQGGRQIVRRNNKPNTKQTTRQSNRQGQGVRLNKVIAESGVASRRAADELITRGRVRVNSELVTELGLRVFPDDRIMVDNKLITKPERHVYIVLNKPKNIITTTKDEKDRKTVLDLVRVRERIYPVGRLDRNTTGVLILTNDGDFANRMMHPKYQVQRTYKIAIDKPLEFKHAKEISLGVELENGVFTQACELFIEDKERQSITLVLAEGKNREVRRMFELYGYDVIKLDRIDYGGISKRGIRRGEWRTLEREEINFLKKNLGMFD